MHALLQQKATFSFQPYLPNSNVHYARYPHPIKKDILLLSTEKGICGLHFLVEPLEVHLQIAQKAFGVPLSPDKKHTDVFWHQLHSNTTASIPLVLAGTPFQQQVWQALCAIPVGTTTYYQAIATKLQKKQSTRAVANAIGQNHIAWLIPCHRILRKNGQLGGYRWGIEIKKVLLNAEKESF